MQGSVGSGRNSEDADSSTDVWAQECKCWAIIEEAFKKGSNSKVASVPSTRVKKHLFYSTCGIDKPALRFLGKGHHHDHRGASPGPHKHCRLEEIHANFHANF